jgi:hypothetical protein
MRMWAVLTFALLLIAGPVCAQSTSGSMAVINSSDPASTTSRVISAPTVVAPGLAAAGMETCLGSASGGLSAMGGGFTFGTTTVDEGCTVRLLARQLFAFGFQHAALALMCEDKHVVVAMYAAGSPCPRVLPITAADPAPHSLFTLGSEPGSRPLFGAATEPAPQVTASEPSQRSSFAAAAELAPLGAANEPSLRSFFAAIIEPNQDTPNPQRRARENGID